MVHEDVLEAELEGITPIVPSLLRLTELVATGTYSLAEVTEVIKWDPALMADVLKYANSTESSSRRQILSIQDAVVRMGGERILQYLMAKWFRGKIRVAPEAQAEQDMTLWAHSITCAVATSTLAEWQSELKHPAGFTAALLHDIGKVVLHRMALRLGMQVEWGLEPNLEAVHSEMELFGIDHAEAGARLLQSWSIPQVIVDAVREHTQPEAKGGLLSDIVRLCNVVADASLEGAVMQRSEHPVSLRWELHGQALAVLAAKTARNAQEIKASFGL